MQIQQTGLQRGQMRGVDLLGEKLVDDAPESIERGRAVGDEHAEVVVMRREGQSRRIDGGQQVNRDLVQHGSIRDGTCRRQAQLIARDQRQSRIDIFDEPITVSIVSLNYVAANGKGAYNPINLWP